MKKYDSECIIELPHELGGQILCGFEYHIENDGIGAYEYWGHCGFDAGHDYMEIDDVEPIWDNQTESEKTQIKEYIEENWSAVCEEIGNKV